MSYRVKRPGSFPEGDLYLDSNGMGNGYMGKAAVKNPAANGSFPFDVKIRFKRDGDDEHFDDDGDDEDVLDGRENGPEIGYIKGWILKWGSGFDTMCDSLVGPSTDQVRLMARTLLNEEGSIKDESHETTYGNSPPHFALQGSWLMGH